MKKVMGLFLLGLILGFTAVSRAEETAPIKPAPQTPAQEDRAEAPDDMEYTFGTVKSVGTDRIVITEFDYDTGEEKEAAYAVDPKVELNNATALKEIVQGDEVDIDYKTEGDKKVAKVISVAKPLPPAEEGQ